MHLKSVSEHELEQAAQMLLDLNARVLLFYGDLGAGKTTLIKQLCKKIGVSDQTSSPTFSIVNQYHTESGKVVAHLDLYRLEDEEELWDIGIEELLETSDHVFVEWPEKIENFLDENYVSVKVVANADGTRSIQTG